VGAIRPDGDLDRVLAGGRELLEGDRDLSPLLEGDWDAVGEPDRPACLTRPVGELPLLLLLERPSVPHALDVGRLGLLALDVGDSGPERGLVVDERGDIAFLVRAASPPATNSAVLAFLNIGKDAAPRPASVPAAPRTVSIKERAMPCAVALLAPSFHASSISLAIAFFSLSPAFFIGIGLMSTSLTMPLPPAPCKTWPSRTDFQ
jgi:hypothetical protein